MNAQVMGTKLSKYSCCAALAALGLMAWTGLAAAQDTIKAGDLSGAIAGQNAVVPITINLGSDQANFFSATFIAAAQGSAPPITESLEYDAFGGLAAPGINDNTNPPQVSMGYLASLVPPLTGTVQVATLTVPIPANAAGFTYEIQVSQTAIGLKTCTNAITTPCKGNSDCPSEPSGGKCTHVVPITSAGQNGTITVIGGGPTATETPVTPGAPTNTPTTAPTNTPTTAPTNTPTTKPTNTPTTAATNTPTKAPTNTPTTAPTNTPTKAASNTPTPTKPTPTRTATSAPTVTATAQVAADASAGAKTLTLQSVPANFPTSGTITAIGGSSLTTPIPFTRSGPTLTLQTGIPSDVSAGTTITVSSPAPAPTATTGCPACEDDDGCQIGANGHSPAWLLLIPAIGLLVVRRRSR